MVGQSPERATRRQTHPAKLKTEPRYSLFTTASRHSEDLPLPPPVPDV
jgi:hypothetical protein